MFSLAKVLGVMIKQESSWSFRSLVLVTKRWTSAPLSRMWQVLRPNRIVYKSGWWSKFLRLGINKSSHWFTWISKIVCVSRHWRMDLYPQSTNFVGVLCADTNDVHQLVVTASYDVMRFVGSAVVWNGPRQSESWSTCVRFFFFVVKHKIFFYENICFDGTHSVRYGTSVLSSHLLSYLVLRRRLSVRTGR